MSFNQFLAFGGIVGWMSADGGRMKEAGGDIFVIILVTIALVTVLGKKSASRKTDGWFK